MGSTGEQRRSATVSPEKPAADPPTLLKLEASIQKEKLVELLEEEHSEYRRLLSLTREKQAALLALKVQELSRIVREEEELLFRIRRLEGKRTALLGKDSPSLSSLAAMVGEPYSSRISDLREGWLRTVNDLKDLNLQNAALLIHAIEQTDRLLHSLVSSHELPSGSSGSKRVYEPSGKPHQESPRELFLNRVV